MMTIKMKVTGMTCGHCEAAVTKALEAVPGVERVVEVSREKETAIVEGDAFVNELVTAIEEEGYQAEPQS
ncbi:MAG: cation transporter [Gemmatimonadota bacterium]|nr:cation transporter [Gemmatimonadota bacterium]MDH5805975.1 cation transporter [Gemmatimonadota bacterium]